MILQDKTILITGGTSGIGRALVDQLSSKNRSIIVIGRNPVKLKDLEESYVNVHTYKCSLSNKLEVERVIGDIVDQHPDVSVVINNAGVQFTPTFLEEDFSFDSIQAEITTNLMAPIWICSLMLGHMLDKTASAFVNITSGLAIYPKTGSAVYCATKAGLHSFSQSFRYQLEHTSIKVFEALLPMVDTKMTEGRGHNKLKVKDAARAIVEGVYLEREENYIGKSRLIPIVARVSPTLMASILKRG